MTERALTLRAVKTVDFMTAKFAHLPFEFPEEVSRRIINKVHGISWVAYDISSKPLVTLSGSDRHSQVMTGTGWQRQASSIRLYR
jgi:GMP synthase PP-ATPase subunit